MIPEREREALMRLTMCARGECAMCKYEKTCTISFQYELATENMNILADALRVADTPQAKLYIDKPRGYTIKSISDTPQKGVSDG